MTNTPEPEDRTQSDTPERDLVRDDVIAEFVEKRRDLLDRLADPEGWEKRQRDAKRDEIIARVVEEDAELLRRLGDS